MIFDELGGTATITFDMDALEAMARACHAAHESVLTCARSDSYPYEVMGSAFTAAALIARVHGDMPEEMTERMARIHRRITTD